MWLSLEVGIVVSGIASTVLYIIASLVNGLKSRGGFYDYSFIYFMEFYFIHVLGN